MFVPRDLRTALHDRGYPLVLDAQLPLLTRLARELEPKDAAADCDVLSAHRGEAVGLIHLGILGVADPDQRLLQEANDRGQHLLSW
nr:hypothetical protein CDS [Bradyrhizobium sp.]